LVVMGFFENLFLGALDGHGDRANINHAGRRRERQGEFDLFAGMGSATGGQAEQRRRAQAAGKWHWWHRWSPPAEGHWYPDHGAVAQRQERERQAQERARTSDPYSDYHVQHDNFWTRRRH
jgi:hypothetical protein